MKNFSIILKRFLLNKGSAFGGIFLLIIIIGAIFAPLIAPYNWNEVDTGPRLAPPSWDFLFGTDIHGRDVFSRIVYGARYSLSVGVISVLFGIIAGSIFGITIAYIGGRVDIIGSRVIDVMFGFPSFLLSLLVVAIIGVGLWNVVFAVGLASIPHFARIIRSAALQVKEQPYIEACVNMGFGKIRIMFNHILPNIFPIIIVIATMDLGGAIISIASLSFLGLGAQPPEPEWGAMLSSGREYMRYAPWTMIYPGLFLFLTVMSVNLLGDRLSIALDARQSVDKGKV